MKYPEEGWDMRDTPSMNVDKEREDVGWSRRRRKRRR